MAGRAALTFKRSMPLVALCAVLGARVAWSQAAPDTPAASDASSLFAAYDVSSVKPAPETRPNFVGAREVPDGITTEFVTVGMLMQSAYGGPGNVTMDDAVTGLPDWAKSTYFSVQAKMSPQQVAAFAKLSKDDQRTQRKKMLQALLADRFRLKEHSITRQVPAYELLIAKGGPSMKESDTNPDMPDLAAFRTSPQVANQSKGRPSMMMTITPQGAEKVIMQGYSMEQLAVFLTRVQDVNHTVADKTGLTGKYSFTLTFAANGGVGPARAPTDSAASEPVPTIFQALEDQLGLRLQRGTATVDTVVVDQVQKPTAD
jgi:uncharacterized protein (TIGR03435 family)